MIWPFRGREPLVVEVHVKHELVGADDLLDALRKLAKAHTPKPTKTPEEPPPKERPQWQKDFDLWIDVMPLEENRRRHLRAAFAIVTGQSPATPEWTIGRCTELLRDEGAPLPNVPVRS